MEKTILNVEGIMCAHCAEAIKKAVDALPGVVRVSVDWKAKTVTVEHNPSQIPIGTIKNEIKDQGYGII